jgi:predicted adenine nucleotide alpha hydrolase (AANH) superfamily ATPase
VDNVLLNKDKILVHTCCAVCSLSPIEKINNNYDIVFYYSNSNIDTLDEFNKRLNNFGVLKKYYTFNIHIDPYDNKAWENTVKEYINEKEKGKRCELCFYYRLERSFIFAKTNNIATITSTLSSSPYKSLAMLFNSASKLEKKYNIKYLYLDFKKNDGFKKAIKLSKEYSLYMQNYCACKYSKKTL